MLSYICILSKNHSRSLLNFFLIGTPTLNRVTCINFVFQKALANALRYFPAEVHEELAAEFARELEEYGHIYMYRFLPSFPLR